MNALIIVTFATLVLGLTFTIGTIYKTAGAILLIGALLVWATVAIYDEIKKG